MTLTKEQLAGSVYHQAGVAKNESAGQMESLLEIIKSTLESGEDVLISGFGKFCVQKRKERSRRHNHGIRRPGPGPGLGPP